MRRVLTITAALVAILATVLAGSLATAQHGHGTASATPGAPGGMMATPRAGMSGTGNGVVYLTIENTGDQDDALVGASTDRASVAEVHEMRVKDNVGMMIPHEGPLAIPAGETVSLEPGGLHLMLIDLSEDIRPGDTFDVTLDFERAGEVTIPVTAVLDSADAKGEPVRAGDLRITGAWSRPAPRIDAGMPATPGASPAA